MFPPFNSTLVARNDIVDRAGPDFSKVIEMVDKGVTDDVMQELNARVDLDKQTSEEVAGQYLEETGLVG
jgi:osmoprotectant transport system substrate-binding protein